MPAAAAVQEQYETLPYPPRNPADERKRLLRPSTAHLPLVNHLFWNGRRVMDADFSVLDAGCGTGDGAVFLADQLRGSGARVVALDISAASIAIARERAAIRGLENITYVQSPIEELPALGLGRFDFVYSSGVLHHLPSPEAGLAVLAGAVKPDGGLAIMVYGAYGRMHIYQMQQMLRLLAPPAMPQAARLDVTKGVLSSLRAGHWAALGRPSWEAEVRRNGDAGVFDLFLHSQDRAYTVPELHEWLRGAGLRLERWNQPALYDPASYAAGIEVQHLSAEERQEAAELLHGRMAMHTFFAVPAGRTVEAVAADDLAAVPVWLLANARELVERPLRDGRELELSYNEEAQRRIALDPFTRAVLRRIDDVTPVGSILDRVSKQVGGVTADGLRGRWVELYGELERWNLVGLRSAA